MEQQAGTRLPAASRKAQIMKVAADLFETRAYQETSMEAIAKEVGIGKASLYYYFSSKDDLLAQMHLGMIVLIIDAHQRRVDDGVLDPSVLLLAMMTDLVSLTETHPGHMRGVFEHFQELPETARAKIAEQRDRYRGTIIHVLDRGVAEGVFTVADPNLTAMAILGMCSWTYQSVPPRRRAHSRPDRRVLLRHPDERHRHRPVVDHPPRFREAVTRRRGVVRRASQVCRSPAPGSSGGMIRLLQGFPCVGRCARA